MTADTAIAERARMLSAVRMMAAMCLNVMQFWMLVPLTSLVLEKRGVGSTAIGLFGAVPWFAILLLSPLMPRAIAAVGPIRFFQFCTLLCVLVDVAFMVTEDTLLWFGLNFVAGAAYGGRWIVSDSVVTSMPPVRLRGRMTGGYAVLVGLGLSGGPALVSLIGAAGWPPFMLNMGLAILAVAPLVGVAVDLPQPDHQGNLVNLLRVGARHPVIPLTAATCGILEMSAAALFPVYGVSLGFPEAKAAMLCGMIGIGGVVCQPLIGWLADLGPRSRILPVLLAVCIGGSLLLPWAVGHDLLLWPLLFLWGCGVTGLYTMTLIMCGKRAGEGEVIPLITVAAMAYTAGGILGPAIGGAAQDAFPPHGLPISLALLAAAGAAVMAIAAVRRARA